MFSFKTSKIQKTFKFLIVDGILHCQQIMPIVHISRPWGASYPSISDDLALLTPIHPEVVASASKSLLDVSNLGKMSALSVSSPALAADLGGGFLWKRLARGGKAKQANSKTRLLEQQQQQQVCGQGSADTLSTQVSWSPTLHESWPVSNAFLSAFGMADSTSCHLSQPFPIFAISHCWTCFLFLMVYREFVNLQILHFLFPE